MAYYSFTVKHTTRDINKALQNNCQNVYLNRTVSDNPLSGDMRVTHARKAKSVLQVLTVKGWLALTENDILTSR